MNQYCTNTVLWSRSTGYESDERRTVNVLEVFEKCGGSVTNGYS